jgi:hypothetical protein
VSGTKIQFDDTEHLIKYLQDNPAGRDILREAVYGRGGEWLENEISDRARPTRVLIEIYRCGWVDVYGPHRCRAQVLFLGRKDTYPQEEVAREQAVQASLPLPYQHLERIATAQRGAFLSCRYCGSEHHTAAQCLNYHIPNV